MCTCRTRFRVTLNTWPHTVLASHHLHTSDDWHENWLEWDVCNEAGHLKSISRKHFSDADHWSVWHATLLMSGSMPSSVALENKHQWLH